MSPAETPGFEQFFEVVVKAPALFDRLCEARDAEALAVLAVEMGHEQGYEFTAADVVERLRTARRTWNERWLG